MVPPRRRTTPSWTSPLDRPELDTSRIVPPTRAIDGAESAEATFASAKDGAQDAARNVESSRVGSTEFRIR